MTSQSKSNESLSTDEHGQLPEDDERDIAPSSIRSPPAPSPSPTYIREPINEHRNSMIILHGRGDSGPSFGTVLVGNPDRARTIFFHANDDGNGTINEEQILPEAMPHTRFIFPSASSRPMMRFKGWPCNQWFDYYSFSDPSERSKVQDEGLHDNVPLIEDLIETEARKVGIENVIVGGISNGAAMALITVLSMIGRGNLHTERRLGGVFGLCGWLPYAADLAAAINSAASGSDRRVALEWLIDRLASRKESGPRDESLTIQVAEAGPEELVLPIFLAHGEEDGVVPIEHLHEARSTLESMKIQVKSFEYPELEHWYSDKMLNDLTDWCDRWKVAS